MELRLADQQRSSEVLPRGAIHLAALIPPPAAASAAGYGRLALTQERTRAAY